MDEVTRTLLRLVADVIVDMTSKNQALDLIVLSAALAELARECTDRAMELEGTSDPF